MLLPGDSTAMFSFMPWGGGICTPECATAFHVAITQPSGVHQVEMTGYNTGTDYLANVAASDGLGMVNGLPVYDLPNNPVQHTGKFLRWALHSTGTESTYKSGDCASSTDCMNVWAIVPPDYDPAKANPWIVHFKGQEKTDILSLFSTWSRAACWTASTRTAWSS